MFLEPWSWNRSIMKRKLLRIDRDGWETVSEEMWKTKGMWESCLAALSEKKNRELWISSFAKTSVTIHSLVPIFPLKAVHGVTPGKSEEPNLWKVPQSPTAIMAKPPLLFMRKIILSNKYHETIEYNSLICNWLSFSFMNPHLFSCEAAGKSPPEQSFHLRMSSSPLEWSAAKTEPHPGLTPVCHLLTNIVCACVCSMKCVLEQEGRAFHLPIIYTLFQINASEMFSWHTVSSLNLQSGSDTRFWSLFPAHSAMMLHSPPAPESLP